MYVYGAPGTGKTSIINELKKRGYECSEEISRNIIIEQFKYKNTYNTIIIIIIIS